MPDVTAAESRSPPQVATPPPRISDDGHAGQTLPGPSQHEVPVDAVSDDPYRVDLESLSSVTAALIKPEVNTPAVENTLAGISVQPSEFFQAAVTTGTPAETAVPAEGTAFEPSADTLNLQQVTSVSEQAAPTSSLTTAGSPAMTSNEGTGDAGESANAVVPEIPQSARTSIKVEAESAPVSEDEPQVASTSAALGLNLADQRPRIFGEGNWEARVVLRATKDSWVQVMSADGSLLLTRVLRPGDRYLVPNRDDLVLMTGNAGGIEIVVDGSIVAAIGPVGAVRHNVSLVPERLLAGTAVER